jgi:hypothetical protein
MERSINTLYTINRVGVGGIGGWSWEKQNLYITHILILKLSLLNTHISEDNYVCSYNQRINWFGSCFIYVILSHLPRMRIDIHRNECRLRRYVKYLWTFLIMMVRGMQYKDKLLTFFFLTLAVYFPCIIIWMMVINYYYFVFFF